MFAQLFLKYFHICEYIKFTIVKFIYPQQTVEHFYKVISLIPVYVQQTIPIVILILLCVVRIYTL